ERDRPVAPDLGPDRVRELGVLADRLGIEGLVAAEPDPRGVGGLSHDALPSDHPARAGRPAPPANDRRAGPGRAPRPPPRAAPRAMGPRSGPGGAGRSRTGPPRAASRARPRRGDERGGRANR